MSNEEVYSYIIVVLQIDRVFLLSVGTMSNTEMRDRPSKKGSSSTKARLRDRASAKKKDAQRVNWTA